MTTRLEMYQRKLESLKKKADTKYRPRFVKELRSGIRFTEGLSVVELCHRWRISRQTFDRWLDIHPDFKDAYQASKADYAAWWQDLNKKVASGQVKGNAGCIIFALTNIEEINWQSKVQVNNTGTEEVKKITIEVLESRQPALEHKQDDIEDAEIIETNVVKMIGSPINVK